MGYWAQMECVHVLAECALMIVCALLDCMLFAVACTVLYDLTSLLLASLCLAPFTSCVYISCVAALTILDQ